MLFYKFAIHVWMLSFGIQLGFIYYIELSY